MTTHSVALPAHGRRLAPALVVLVCAALLAAIVVGLVLVLGGSGAAHAVHPPVGSIPRFLTRIGRPQ